MGILLQDIKDLNLISEYKYKTTLAKALSSPNEVTCNHGQVNTNKIIKINIAFWKIEYKA